MKQELVQLAKDKGFVATFVHDKPFIYSSKEPLRWLFWMTELQKWLREVNNSIVEVLYQKKLNAKSLYYVATVDYYTPTWELDETEHPDFISENVNTYEEGLEIGLFEALKLLKDIE